MRKPGFCLGLIAGLRLHKDEPQRLTDEKWFKFDQGSFDDRQPPLLFRSTTCILDHFGYSESIGVIRLRCFIVGVRLGSSAPPIVSGYSTTTGDYWPTR